MNIISGLVALFKMTKGLLFTNLILQLIFKMMNDNVK